MMQQKRKKNQIENHHLELGVWQGKVDLLFVLAINVVKVLGSKNKMMQRKNKTQSLELWA
jgi:hypothetical protein